MHTSQLTLLLHLKYPNEMLFLLLVSCCLYDHIPLTHERMNRSVCVCNREHVLLLFFFFFFFLFCVCVCYPVTQLRAKPPLPCWSVRGPRLGFTITAVLCVFPLSYHRTFFSLHPCPRHCSPAPIQTPIKCF